MLEINNLVVKYGGITALDNISMNVEEGKIISLVGANGAGKSTTLRAITKLVTPVSGSIKYNGVELTNLSTQDIVKMGITLVPEGRHVFAEMTVEENLMIGAYLRKDKENFKKDIDFIHEMFP